MSADAYSVEFEMTDGLASKYARALLADRWFFCRFARGLGLPVYLLAVFLFAPVLPTLALRLPAGPLFALLAVVGLVLWVFFFLVLYRQARDIVLLPFRGQPQRMLRVTFADGCVTLTVAGVDLVQKWDEIEAVRVYRSLWLFRLRCGGYFAVPDSEVTPALEALVRGKAEEFKIDVRD
jgi:hypothetical protein